MANYLFVPLLVIIISTILFAGYRFGKSKKKIKITQILLKINIWLSVLFGISASLLITAMGHTEQKNWGFTILLAFGITIALLIPSYLAFVSFANEKLIAQIYIWGYSLFLILFAFVLFPFSTILGLIIIFGQLAWYKIEKE